MLLILLRFLALPDQHHKHLIILSKNDKIHCFICLSKWKSETLGIARAVKNLVGLVFKLKVSNEPPSEDSINVTGGFKSFLSS